MSKSSPRVGYRFSVGEQELVDRMKAVAPKHEMPFSNETRLLYESACAKADGHIWRRPNPKAVGGFEYCWHGKKEE